MFLIYHVTSRDHVFKELCWINGLKLLIVSHHFAKLCGHRRCRSSDTAAKIVYMTLQDHMIKGSDGFMEGNSWLYIPTPSKLIAIETC